MPVTHSLSLLPRPAFISCGWYINSCWNQGDGIFQFYPHERWENKHQMNLDLLSDSISHSPEAPDEVLVFLWLSFLSQKTFLCLFLLIWKFLKIFAPHWKYGNLISPSELIPHVSLHELERHKNGNQWVII